MLKPLICHINLARGYRGGERQTELLIRALHDLGYRQRLIARAGEPLLARMRTLPGLECTAARPPFLSRIVACRGATLVQVHEAKGGYLASVARSLYGIPYVITRRTHKPPRVTTRNRRLYANAAAVVTVSAMIADVLSSLGLCKKAELIADARSDLPVDAVAVAAIRNRFAGKFLLGHAAALYDEGKGQSVLIEAMRLLADELPNLQLLFMGSGQDELMLKNAASDLNNVSFEGFTDRLGDYFAALDMYVHPSRREGLGSVLLDAMQAELPIIASCVGGIPEIIDDHVNGLLVPAGNARVLADMILRLYADTDLSRALAQRGKACAEQYTSEIMAHKYAQLYQALSA